MNEFILLDNFRENRKYKYDISLPDDFDEEAYLKLNLDLKENNIFDGIQHYLTNGYLENRKYKYDISLPDDFDEEAYLKLNLDLKENNIFDGIHHYLTNGYLENRKYKYDISLPEDFNEEAYFKLNQDLKENNIFDGIHHYLTNGYFKNVKYKYDISLPDDFNEEIYFKLNLDLKENNIFDGIHHYLTNGYFEKRKYKVELPYDFNEEVYFKLNPDLKENNIFDGIHHYLTNGYFEKIKYKVELPYDFNEEIYLKLNPDVIAKYKYNPKIHYTKYGYFEKRNYKLEDNLSRSILNFNETNFVNLDNTYKKINNIDLFKSFILIVDFPKLGGGTNVFLNTILKKYKYRQTFLIVRKINEYLRFTINDDYELDINFNDNECIHFLKEIKDKILKIFINHTLFHSNYFLNALFELEKETTTITHDYYLINDNPQPYYEEIQLINDISLYNKININQFDEVICQNKATSNIFERFVDKNKIIISKLPDFEQSLDIIDTFNNTIIIGVIGEVSTIKGKELIEQINEYIQKNNINMKIIVFGHTIENSNLEFYRYYNINDLNNLLIKYKPNLILETSIWPETYSYTLSLSIISRLPIISLKKKYDSVIANRLLSYKKKFFFETIPEFIELANKHQQNYFFTIEPTIYFNDFWDNYFITNKNKQINLKNFKYDIKPYFIYFPQFHSISENNITFYPNFTDTENLHLLNQSKISYDIETPFLKELNINNIHEYNLENKELLQKQIEIINDYNFAGLAIYYYWFSTNTITNKNMIMDKVVNTFFDDSINLHSKKVFFIWANEDWSGNDAFGNTNEKIENKYTFDNIKKNVDNLMIYFKHENYLKIDDKPVFFIYHPWLISDNEFELLNNILNEECKLNNFKGVYMIINNMLKEYEDYYQFAIHFNYKSSNFSYNKNQKVINFKDYLDKEDNFKNDCLQTIALDFDNRARLMKPNKLNKASICIENTEANKIYFINKILEKYNKEKKSELENILLINSFNEWGEKMTFEPSVEYGYYNLNLLTKHLS